jgi:hypothetical protein
MDNLYIPSKINVGFQNRKDTYTGKLAYVSYVDSKGVFRKQKSWDQWRDQSITPLKLDNTPQEGFCLNKEVERYNWSHFSSNRSYIRMYDPRGIEFEISPENLIGILTESNCLKRGLEGKFVYAWNGTELVLLPCVSEEYAKAQKHTERQAQDISTKDLKPGISYTRKDGKEVVFIGKLPVYSYDYESKTRVCKKKFVFYCEADKNTYYDGFEQKSDIKFLAFANSDTAVLNYAELVSMWNNLLRSSKIVNFEYPQHPQITSIPQSNHSYYGGFLFVEATTKNQSSVLTFYYAQKNSILDTYYVTTYSSSHLVILNSQSGIHYNYNHNSSYGNYVNKSYSESEIIQRINNSVEVYAVLENGNKIKITEPNSLFL